MEELNQNIKLEILNSFFKREVKKEQRKNKYKGWDKQKTNAIMMGLIQTESIIRLNVNY